MKEIVAGKNNPYKVLGLSRFNSEKEAQSKYRELCKYYHPDNLKTGDAVKFHEIQEAWGELKARGNAFGLKGNLITHKTIFNTMRVGGKRNG